MSRTEADDWQAVRSTRLTALAVAPFTFGSTRKREMAFGDQEWQRRVRDGNWSLAWIDNQQVGVVAGIHETGHHDERHLIAMRVHDDHRGTVLTADLVQAICNWTTVPGARLVLLWVARQPPRTAVL